MTILTTRGSLRYGRRTRGRPLSRIAAGLLAAAIGCAPFGFLTSVARASSAVTYTTVNVPSLLVFPFANDAGDSASELGPRLDDALLLRLDAVAAYKVTRYTKFLPQVQRAIQDRILSDDDAGGPFDSASKAGTVAQQVDTDQYLIGSIESYTSDPSSRHVTIEVSAELHKVATGSTVKTMAFTGEAVPEAVDESLDAITQEAIDDAASKIASAINANHVSGGFVSTQRQHNNTAQIFLITLLTGVMAYAIAHNSQHNNSGSSSTTVSSGTSSGTTSGISPPPPP